MITYKKSLIISEEENIKLDEYYYTKYCEPHVHDFFELVYTQSGAGIHKIDDVEYQVTHGDLIFISCNQIHSYHTETGMKMTNILITPEFISNELIDAESITELFRHSIFAEFNLQEMPLQQCIHFQGSELLEVDAIVNMMVREFTQKSLGYKSVLHGCVRILFSKILRHMHTTITDKSYEAKNLFDDIRSYINENYSRKISLSEIAAKSFYNPVYFGNKLKKYFGKTFSVYLKEKRITEAAKLLKTTELSVNEVMIKVGYNDKKLFYTHFKEIFAVTPGKYK